MNGNLFEFDSNNLIISKNKTTAIVGLVAPQFGRVAAPAGAYALGGLEGVIGNFAFDFVRGRMANGTTAQNATPAMEVL